MNNLSFACVVLLAVSGMAPLFEETPTEPTSGSDGPSASRRAGQRPLEPFNDWVGTWRGVGQPKRGSTKGAWTEQTTWEWKIGRDTAGLQFAAKNGKLFQDGVLSFDAAEKKFRLKVTLAEGKSRLYTGEQSDKGKLVLLHTNDDSGDLHRVTLHMLHADRMLLLAESKPGGQSNYARLAEIGYTRKGGSFATSGDGYPKCIVTGGRGTMSVEYKEKTYYVCCTGCKQAFLDDPDEILADAAERSRKEATGKKKGE